MRYQATVAYDGTNYNGWQKQCNGIGIQAIIEEVLERITCVPTEIVGSGRTDAGVHAYGQVFHFDCEKDIAPYQMKLALNTGLPADIRIQEVRIVADDFHARFHASGKRYDYLITYVQNDPFIYRYRVYERYVLDVIAMRKSAEVLVGTHDFTSFTSARIDERKPRVKTITSIEIIEETDGLRMVFEGEGFLRYQVRMMAQTLIEVGKGKLCIEDVKRILDGKAKGLCKYKAPAKGLYLMRVDYANRRNDDEKM